MSPELRERLIALLERLESQENERLWPVPQLEIMQCLQELRSHPARPLLKFALQPTKASACAPECPGHTDGKFCKEAQP